MFSELSCDAGIHDRRFPSFSRPKIIGYLSLDGQRQYLHNASRLKFTKPIGDSEVSFDLNLKYEDTKLRLKNLNEKISHLLQFLLQNEIRLNFPFSDSLKNSIFFCYRGLLTCIASSPYENREPWRIVATLFQGDIYLCALDTEEKTRENNNMNERQKRCTSWGYKFEHYLLSDKPHMDPDPNSGTDENEEFSLVFVNNLNEHTIVYGAEMDGVIVDNETTSPSEDMSVEQTLEYLLRQKFIELKTNAHLEFPNHHKNFRRFKTRKWWLQSFLAGVDTIVCGFRNQEGVVENLKLFSTDQLPKMSQKYWKPNVCFNFLDTFLTYIKRCLAKEIRRLHGDAALTSLPVISLHFEWSPNDLVRVTNTYCYDSDPILPEWFINSYRGKKPVEIK